MNYLERVRMELQGIDADTETLTVYLLENGILDPLVEYQASEKRSILKTVLNVLESLANDPNLMKNYKLDDVSVTQFHRNLSNRIETLKREISNMDMQNENRQWSMLFK